jgi:N-acetylglucosaminyl-diphospho-decaprenol L-rhamnosyltransferase
MKLLVVIVNYRTPDLTVECLRSLATEIATIPGPVRVVVTDNDSQDESVVKIQQAIESNNWAEWVTLMPLPSNGGFAYGNNRGMLPWLKGQDPPEYVYLLNPDTVVLTGALLELVKFMDEHRYCGIAGGRAVNPDGSVRNSAFRFHTVLSELEGSIRLGVVTKWLKQHVVATAPPETPQQVDWVSGASMMIRKEVFDCVGMLDEGYFMYYEETDFCLRAAKAGWPTWYVPTSRIIHLVGQSSGVTGQQRTGKRRPAYWFESRHRYYRRHYGALRTLAADFLWAGGYAVSSLLQKLRGRQRTDPPWLWWDFVRYNLKDYFRRPRAAGAMEPAGT